jgi:DNA-nicking Smr family endonuclease
MSRRRILTPEEREIWARVAHTAQPMHPKVKASHPPEPRPAPAVPKPKPPMRDLMRDFQIGDSSRPLPQGHDVLPPLEERLAQQPLRMDRKTHQQMVRGKTAPEGRIDLHGMTLSEAHPELIHFILRSHENGKRLVLVITGKGKLRDDWGPIPTRLGILRHQVPVWLTQPPLGSVVMQIAPAHLKHGGTGAYYVYLRRAGGAQPR